MNVLIQENKKNIEKIQELLEIQGEEDEVTSARLDKIEEELRKIPEVYEKKDYEFTSLPVGTLIGQHDKEYRLMIPKTTVYKEQTGGGEKNKFYIAFKAYAPNDKITKFKEGANTTKEVEDKIYDFNDDFAGTDKYGRNYSIVWLPVAAKGEDGNWTYYGAKSTNDHYIGWYYTVEWYDDRDTLIASDQIRINLSNEDCHNNLVPSYMEDYITSKEVDEKIKEIQDGSLDINAIPLDIIQGLKWTDSFED